MSAADETVDALARLLGRRVGNRGRVLVVGDDTSGLDAALRDGGVDAHRSSPTDLQAAAADGDGRLVAIVLPGTLGTAVDPSALLADCCKVADRTGAELVVAEANVAHMDIGAKLALGHWDLEGDGRLHRYDAATLTRTLRRAGFVEVDAADAVRAWSDQHFPPDAPELADGSQLASLLRGMHDYAGDRETETFVRAYARTTTTADQPTADSGGQPFLSVVMRTQGRRAESLIEALTCLAGQTATDFEVLLVVHGEDDEAAAAVRSLVADFAAGFAERVRVVRAVGGGRARPLNTGLQRATGRYLAFLDDDDLVLAHWVSTFRAGAEAAPGAIIRCLAATRPVTRRGPGAVAPFEPVGGPEVRYSESFEVLGQLTENHTPIHTFAVPMTLVHRLDLSFDESLPVLEDWDFLMRCASVVGVHDTGAVTAIYNWWEAQESSLHTVPNEVWESTRLRVVDRLSARPLVLPAGAARIIDEQNRELRDLRHEYGRAREDLDLLLQSEWWRATAPFRKLVQAARSRWAR